MRILGIDPGIADTGDGIIEADGQKMKCLGYGSIRTRANTPLPERLESIYQELDGLIKQYRPDRIGVEELFFCNNAKTALIVGQARGAVLLCARQNRVPISEFTPLQVKQAVSAYGKAGKDQVQRMVKLLLGLDQIPQPDDAADALAIAICTSNAGIEKIT